MDLKEYIRTIPDFPQMGILYRDITPLLNDHKVFSYVINQLSDKIPKDITSIVAPESRGFIFASAVCYKTNRNLVLVRKKGKLPYKTFDIEYEFYFFVPRLQTRPFPLESFVACLRFAFCSLRFRAALARSRPGKRKCGL